MNKYIIAVSVLAALFLLISSIASAEPTHPNEVGLYMNEDGTGATGTNVVGIPVHVFLVLTNPEDPQNGNEPYSTINAFELAMFFSPVPISSLFLMEVVLPNGGIDVGIIKNMSQGIWEFRAGWSPDSPVTGTSFILATLTFLNLSPEIIDVALGPITGGIGPSIPGQMCFQSVLGQLRVLYPVSGSHEAPVFIFNGEAVAVEKESFGSVKALYR